MTIPGLAAAPGLGRLPMPTVWSLVTQIQHTRSQAFFTPQFSVPPNKYWMRVGIWLPGVDGSPTNSGGRGGDFGFRMLQVYPGQDVHIRSEIVAASFYDSWVFINNIIRMRISTPTGTGRDMLDFRRTGGLGNSGFGAGAGGGSAGYGSDGSNAAGQTGGAGGTDGGLGAGWAGGQGGSVISNTPQAAASPAGGGAAYNNNTAAPGLGRFRFEC